jgi:HK97 family phage major capsid protein
MKTQITSNTFSALLKSLQARLPDQPADLLAQSILDDHQVVDDQGQPIDVVIHTQASANASAASVGAKSAVAAANTAAPDLARQIDAAVAKALEAFRTDAGQADAAPAITVGHYRRDNPQKSGFRHMGEFLGAVVEASRKGASAVDPRLLAKAAPSLYGQTSVGADGGFMVPTDFSTQVLQDLTREESLLSRCHVVRTQANSVTLPTDETNAWDSTGGIQAYWTHEAQAAAQSKPSIRQTTLQLHKLTVLVPVTEELLSDAQAVGSYVSAKAAQKIDFKVSEAILRGTGVGEPLGLLTAGSLVTQAKEGSQSADTLNATNITRMFSRLLPGSVGRACWLVHPSVWPQLAAMTIGNQPVFQSPIAGLAGAPQGTLLGRPIITTQHSAPLGDKGDIVLADFSQYLALVKSTGIQATQSMHLWFDQDLMAFKFTFRMAGQPWRSAAVAAREGSDTLSAFITLEAR